MNVKFNIWVFLKKGKVDHNGLCPIYMRIKLNGECIEKATKLFSNQNDWNTKNQRSRNNDLTNLEIESQKAKIYNTLSQLLDEIDNVTVYDLKNRLNKKTVRPTILSEIAAKCGIDKRVTFHLARHTFATTVTLNNNIPIETVSMMLGHSRINTTQIYAKILEKKIGEDMLRIRDL